MCYLCSSSIKSIKESIYLNVSIPFCFIVNVIIIVIIIMVIVTLLSTNLMVNIFFHFL